MNIIMLGAPGTGKGTIAGILEKELKIPQVSTGDIFRKHMKEGTELGKLAESYISKGALVPDDVTIGLVEDRLKEKRRTKRNYTRRFPKNSKTSRRIR